MADSEQLNNKFKEILKEIYTPVFTSISNALSEMTNISMKIEIEHIDKFSNFNFFLDSLDDKNIVCNLEEYNDKQGLFSLTILPFNAAIDISNLLMGQSFQGKDIDDVHLSFIKNAFSRIVKEYNNNIPDVELKIKETITQKEITKLKNTITYPIIVVESKFIINGEEYYFIRVVPEDILMFDKKNKDETEQNKDNFADTKTSKHNEYSSANFGEFAQPTTKEETAKTTARAEQPITVQPVQFPSFDNHLGMKLEGNRNFDLLLDIKLKLTVELGRTEMPIKKILELTRGSIIELDKAAGESVDLYAGDKIIAKGEVVVIEDNFGLRIISIVSPDDRIKNL